MKRLRWPVALFLLIQLAPYGRDHSNPPVRQEPPWDSPRTRELFRRACFDCHSNETVWPWYANLAPVSWIVQNDVEGGRAHLNFSEWDRPQRSAEDVALVVLEGEMPPWIYRPLHPEARLSGTEQRELVAGAERSLGPQRSERPREKLFP
jgi:mono/diheme cytochrome c family protein